MCTSNSDCPAGQRCDSGECVPAGHPPGTPIKPPTTTIDESDADADND